MEITLEEIEKKFDSLPEDLKWAIMGANIDEKITTIGQLHGLNIEQIGQLSLETHMVVLGYTHPNKFEESVKGSLNLPDGKNKEIITEINDKILKDIRERLMSLSKSEEDEKKPIENIEEKIEEEVKTPEKENETKEKGDLEKELENKKIMETVYSQKLSAAFQAPTTKTEYSLKNISKNSGKSETSTTENVKIPFEATIQHVGSDTQSISPSYSIKEDPYRAKPE
jgi:hypothetical protein